MDHMQSYFVYRLFSSMKIDCQLLLRTTMDGKQIIQIETLKEIITLYVKDLISFLPEKDETLQFWLHFKVSAVPAAAQICLRPFLPAHRQTPRQRAGAEQQIPFSFNHFTSETHHKAHRKIINNYLKNTS